MWVLTGKVCISLPSTPLYSVLPEYHEASSLRLPGSTIQFCLGASRQWTTNQSQNKPFLLEVVGVRYFVPNRRKPSRIFGAIGGWAGMLGKCGKGSIPCNLRFIKKKKKVTNLEALEYSKRLPCCLSINYYTLKKVTTNYILG